MDKMVQMTASLVLGSSPSKGIRHPSRLCSLRDFPDSSSVPPSLTSPLPSSIERQTLERTESVFELVCEEICRSMDRSSREAEFDEVGHRRERSDEVWSSVGELNREVSERGKGREGMIKVRTCRKIVGRLGSVYKDASVNGNGRATYCEDMRRNSGSSAQRKDYVISVSPRTSREAGDELGRTPPTCPRS